MELLLFNLRELQQVQAIAAEGSLVRAARTLHISQPALSRSLKEIEEKADLRLFDRGREGAALTDAGRMVLRHAEAITSAAFAMQRELALIRGLGKGELRVGAGLFPSELFLGRALAQLSGARTGIQLRVIGGRAPYLLKLLQSREVDLVVADPLWLEGSGEVATVNLSTHRGYFVVRAGHPLIGATRLEVDAIAAYPLVTSPSVTQRLSRFPTTGKSRRASGRNLFASWIPAISTDSITVMKEAVRVSDAVTILPLYSVRHELRRQQLKVLAPSPSWIKAQFAFMYLSHRTCSPLAEALIEAARQAAAQVVDEERVLAEKFCAKARS